MATSGDTAETPTTDAAATSTTGAAMRACEAYAAADLGEVEQFCPCGAELGRRGQHRRVCALETDDPAHAESITCQTDTVVVSTTCVSSLSWDEYDTQPEWGCFGIYLDAYDACDKAFRASTLAVETQCEDVPPFTCQSGERVPWSFVCDGEPGLHGHVRRIRRAMPRMIATSERGSGGERARVSACRRGARVAGAGSSGACSPATLRRRPRSLRAPASTARADAIDVGETWPRCASEPPRSCSADRSRR